MRHFDVGDKDVGFVRQHRFQRLLTVFCLGDHRNVAFDFEQSREGAQHHALILGKHNSDRLAAIFQGGIQFAPSICRTGAFKGKVIVTVVPDAPIRCRVPPTISTRSRIPPQTVALAAIPSATIVADLQAA